MASIDAALDLLRPGMRVFVPGSAGEPTALLDALAADPDRTRDIQFVTTAVPGINRFDWSRLHPSATITGLFMLPALAPLQREGRFRHLPTSYAGFVERIAADTRSFDLALVQLAPPDGAGRCSMGPAVEFLPAVLARGTRIAAVANASLPPLPAAPAVALTRLELLVDADTPLPVYDAGGDDAASAAIAGHVARFVGDGATIQCGLGKVPTALLRHLGDRRGLRLYTGMYGEGVPAIARTGALAVDGHTACVAVGTPALYDWFRDRPDFRLEGCERTHNVGRLAALTDFVAVNSAVEVDLFGQASLEHAGGAAISGAGGAPDFARGARLSRGGISIVALPASAARGTRSRIVAALDAPAVATLPRCDVDVVVTEHGAADLRDLSVHERAERLISVAKPAQATALADAWARIAARL